MDELTGETPDVEVKSDIPATIPKAPKNKPKKFSLSKFMLLVLLMVVLSGASAYGAYLWRDSMADKLEKQQAINTESFENIIASFQKQIADAKTTDTTDTTVEEDVCTEVAPNATAIDNIKASITSANTAALEGYMATSVNVILAATEAYGPQTPTQAISDISVFLGSDIDSWDYDFSLSAATLTSYQTGDYSQYFSTISVVGKATNDQLISFSFDCNGKIDTVFLATNSSLL